MPAPCTFCRIVAGELPASVLLREEGVVAFLDIRPVRSGHALVVPATHAVHLAELDDEAVDRLWRTGRRVAAAAAAALPACDGHNFAVNDGSAAGQSVPHVHLHVVPRAAGDGLRFLAGLGGNLAGLALGLPVRRRRRERLDAMAARIRARLGRGEGVE